MKFIKPSEISSKIMTLIEESDEYVIIVSPYVKISKWYKLLKKLDNLNERNVPVDFLIRDDRTNQTSFNELNELGIMFSAIKDLHCKLYLNEKYAIVSSMNLLLSSEINSLELAYKTETVSELNELKDFCQRYLNIDFTRSLNSNTDNYEDWRDSVCQQVSQRIGKHVKAQHEDGSFLINTGSNNYSAFIWNSKQNLLRISGILSRKEFDFLSQNIRNMPEVDGIMIELQKGGNGYYDTIGGTLEMPLRSIDLDSVLDKERYLIAEKVTQFILEIDGFKEWASKNIQ